MILENTHICVCFLKKTFCRADMCGVYGGSEAIVAPGRCIGRPAILSLKPAEEKGTNSSNNQDKLNLLADLLFFPSKSFVFGGYYSSRKQQVQDLESAPTI